MADQINTPINYPVIAGGRIVVGGSVLFGNENQRPDEDNPATLKAIFVDSNLTVPAQNPQPLGSNGQFDQSVNGTLYGPDDSVYSVLILDRRGRELSYTPSFNLNDTAAATAASVSAAAAAQSESNAAQSEAAAAAIGLQVAASYADFVNRYFGAFPSDPSVDPAGNPPNKSSIYFNTTSDVFFTWNGSAWINYFPSNPNGILVTATGTTTARTLGDRFFDEVSIEDFSSLVVEDDWSDALQAASNTGRVVTLSSGESYTLKKPVIIPLGSGIIGKNGTGGTYLNNDDTTLYDNAPRLLIDHGVGITDSNRSSYYQNAAITASQGTEFRGFSIWYPSQDIGISGPPNTYPPAISTAQGAKGVTIDTINIGNSYIGIDARRDQSNISINNIWGYPLFKGIRIGSNTDPSYISNVYFSPVRGFEGDPWINPNISSWVAQNGTMVEIGRLTWSQFTNIWSIGYGIGIDMINQQSDPANGINTGGSAQNCNFIGCGFDSNEVCINGSGFQGRINIVDCNFVPKNFNNNPSRTTYGVLMSNTAGTVTDVNISDCHFWAIAENGIKLTGQNGSKIQNCSLKDLSNSLVGTAIELNGSQNSRVSGSTIDGASAVTGSIGINITNNCDNSTISQNKVINLNGAPLSIDATDNSYITGNVFNGNSQAGIQDVAVSKKYSNVIKDNIDPSFLFSDYDNTDVNANGFLSINIGSPVIRYLGTSRINGITHGRQGETIVMRFSGVATITDGNPSTPSENRLNLNGDFTTSLGSTLTLTSFGSLGWFEVSRSAN